MITVEQVLSYARETLGTPFQHQGRISGLAMDCAGVAAHVATRLNVEFNEWPGYGRIPHQGLLEAVMDAQPCLTIAADKQPGDILLMTFERDPQHIAIYAGETIIHAYESIGRVVEHRLNAEWSKKIIKSYRFKGITA